MRSKRVEDTSTPIVRISLDPVRPQEDHVTQTMTPSTVASRISKALEQRIGRHRYDMWFGHSTKFRVDGEHVEVATDSQFVADWIEGHFTADLHGIVRETLGDRARLDVKVAPDLFPTAGSDGQHAQRRLNGLAPGRDPKLKRPDTTRPSRPHRRTVSLRSLDDFVVGDCNRLAYSAAQRLADSPDRCAVSPLFVHGECGLGKTHLVQGICRQFAEQTARPSAARYLTGEQFTNEYIAAVRHQTIDAFRRRMRKLELLAIDDVHFLSNKVATQSEFLHTIDALELSGARIVLTSDDHPRQIKRFSQALISRFLSGMVVKIVRPDRDTRTELIRRLSTSRGLVVGDQVVERIAANCVGSVREIEGAITKLAALRMLSSDQQVSVGTVLTDQLFDDHGWKPSAPIRIGAIIDIVCEQLAVDRASLMGSCRHRSVVLARALVAYLGRELTTLSYPEIARALSRTYHSTIHTAAQRLRRQLDEDLVIDRGLDGQPQSLRELTDQLRHLIRRAAASS